MHLMASPVQDPPALYIALALVMLWRLPLWGSRILDFLRDLRAFRDRL
jgi:hypothetical protein